MCGSVFVGFNENLKSGPISERNYRLFKADGNIPYNTGFNELKSLPATPSTSCFKDIQIRSSPGFYSSDARPINLAKMIYRSGDDDPRAITSDG
ncbi:hypothetical protein U1Q18_013215 [Sarracenia purpurea var. burkii]